MSFNRLSKNGLYARIRNRLLKANMMGANFLCCSSVSYSFACFRISYDPWVMPDLIMVVIYSCRRTVYSGPARATMADPTPSTSVQITSTRVRADQRNVSYTAMVNHNIIKGVCNFNYCKSRLPILNIPGTGTADSWNVAIKPECWLV